MRNDELELLSKYGLTYNHPERISALLFDDGTVLEFWSDLDRTCASMEKISPKDAENYRRFVDTVDKTLDMLVMGMFSVPRSEEHTSELQSLMRTSYAVFCLNKKKILIVNCIPHSIYKN